MRASGKIDMCIEVESETEAESEAKVEPVAEIETGSETETLTRTDRAEKHKDTQTKRNGKASNEIQQQQDR